jgi:hypothetical protein
VLRVTLKGDAGDRRFGIRSYEGASMATGAGPRTPLAMISASGRGDAR